MKKCVATVMTLVSFPFNLFAVVLPQSSYTDMDMSYDGQSVYNSGIYGDDVLNAGDFNDSDMGDAELYVSDDNCMNDYMTPQEAADQLNRFAIFGEYQITAATHTYWAISFRYCIGGALNRELRDWMDEFQELARQEPNYDPDYDEEGDPPLAAPVSTEPVFLAVLLAGFAIITNRKRLFTRV